MHSTVIWDNEQDGTGRLNYWFYDENGIEGGYSYMTVDAVTTGDRPPAFRPATPEEIKLIEEQHPDIKENYPDLYARMMRAPRAVPGFDYNNPKGLPEVYYA